MGQTHSPNGDENLAQGLVTVQSPALPTPKDGAPENSKAQSPGHPSVEINVDGGYGQI